MHRGSSASLVRSCAGMIAAIFIVAHPIVAAAQEASADQEAAFNNSPISLITANPNGGDNLAAAVKALVLGDKSNDNTTLNNLITLAQNLNAQLSNPNNSAEQNAAIQAQLAAIGQGLAQAAAAVVTTNPSLAQTIQAAVAASGVPTAVASYNQAAGGSQTAAAGSGGGAGGPTNSGAPTGGSGGGGGGSTEGSGSGSGGGSASGSTGGGSGGGSGGGGTTTAGQSTSGS